MKKLLFLLLITASTFAQTRPETVTITNDIDTLINSGTVKSTAYLKSKSDVITISVKVTKISGTVTGTAILQGSIDGALFFPIGSDTLTFTNITNPASHKWELDKNRYTDYRVLTTGGATGRSLVVAKLYKMKL